MLSKVYVHSRLCPIYRPIMVMNLMRVYEEVEGHV